MEKPKGMTTEDLAKALPLNRTSTAKYLNTLLVSGQIEQQVVGRARLFTCCNRVPMAQMLSFSSDSVIVMDSERMIREINPQFIESFGIREQDLIGKKFDTLSSDVDITYLLMPGICQAVDGQSVTKTLEIKKGDEVLHFSSKYLPVVLEDGLPGAAVVLENITEANRIQAKYEKIQEENVIERTLRAAAEEQLARFPKHPLELEGQTPEELIHELQVNQIELQMQGEELRNSKTALIESRDKYLDLYEFAPVGYLTLTDTAQVRDVNLTGAALLRTDRKDLVTTRFSKFIAEKDADQWHTYFMHVLKQKEKLACTLTLRRGDGSMFPAQLESIRITDHSEGTPTVRVVIHNITDIRQLAEALGNSEGKLNRILNAVTDVVWSLTWPDMKVHYISPSVKQLYGRTLQEFIDKPSLWAEVTHPDDKHMTDNALEQLQKTGSSVRECRIVRPDGSIVWVHAKSHMVFDEHGTPIHVEGITSDITRRKRAEALLRQNAELLAFAIEGSGVGLWDWEVQTGKTEFNERWAEIAGYTLSELQPVSIDTWTHLCHPDDLQQSDDLLKAHFSKESPSYECEVRIRHKDGHWVWVLDRGKVVKWDSDGLPIRVTGTHLDITDRKMAEEMRQTIFDSIPVMVMFFDREGHFQFINRCLQSTLGWSLEEMLQHKDIFAEFYPDPEYRSYVFEHIRKTAGTGHWCDFKTRTKDGNILDTTWINVPLSDGSVIGTGIDITERKRAEEALHLKDTALVTSINAIAITDLSGTITYVNPAFLSLCGYADTQEVLGLSVLSFTNLPDAGQQIIGEIQEHGTWSGEITGQRKDGTLMQVQASIHLIRDAAGAPVAMMGSVIDITDRKQTEMALHEGEQQYRALFDTITEGVVLIAPDGQVVSANPAAEYILGLTQSEIEGSYYDNPDWYFLHPDGTPMPREEFATARVMKEKCPVLAVIMGVRRPDGAVFWINVNAVPLLDETGTLKGIVVTFTDITSRKQAEEQLLQVNQQISLLTDITRHDILNKVTAITGHVSIARKKFSDPGITGLFDTIDTNTKEIKSQIEFTRIYQDLGSQEPQWLNLEYLMSQLRVPPQITLQSSLQGIEIYGDPLFKQVFFNLLDNAERHGGHVTTITVSALHSRLGLTILCEDNGVGIPEDQKKKIFKRGFGKSTGLGLFLMQEVLGITGMKIRENGIKGTGARFEITVPKGAFRTTAGAVPR